MSMTLSEAAEWHERLATIHLAAADPDAAAGHLSEAARHDADATRATTEWETDRRAVNSLIRAHRATDAAARARHLAASVAADQNYGAHVTHALAAAQIRALAEHRDATDAARVALEAMAAAHAGDADFISVLGEHPTVRLLGVILPNPSLQSVVPVQSTSIAPPARRTRVAG